MVNNVTLIGNLGDDVKIHRFEGGNCVGSFSVATNRSWKDKTTGEKMTKTSWHNIKVRNKLAELCEKYLGKGDKVYLSGEIDYRKWTDAEGKDHYSTEINVMDLRFLETKNQGTAQPRTETTSSNPNSNQAGAKETAQTGRQPVPPPEEDDDLPF